MNEPDIAALPEQLHDPVWRLTSGFYTIRSEDGKPIPFIPTPQQLAVIHEVYVMGFDIIGIPKARQVRMSTLICLICLDTVLFGSSVQISLVDKDVPSAKKKMEEKILYAWKRIPRELRDQLWEEGPCAMHPSAYFTVYHRMFGGEPGVKSSSVIYAGDNARGGTNQLLFMTEWQEVEILHPAKSREYLEGAWPSAERGLRIIETSWSGGPSGNVYGIMGAGIDKGTGLPLPVEKVKKGIPRILFFPWYVIPERRIEGEPDEVRPETREYFRDIMRQTGDALDDAQMLWYQRKVMDILGYRGRHIYPSIIHECWEGKIEGAIWGDAIAKAREMGCVAPMPHDPALEVDTFWDLGAPENQPCCYVQHHPGRRHIIDLDSELPDTMVERIRRLKQKGYQYGTHFLPHDGGARQKNGKTFTDEFREELARQGVTGRVVPLRRTPSILTRINYVSQMLREGRLCLNEELPALLESMNGYRWEPDKSRAGRYLDRPAKDYTNHICDAVGYIAEAELADHLPTTGAMTTRNLYFDADVIRELTAESAVHPAQTWDIDARGETFRHVSGRQSPQGWLRVWESPQYGVPYLIGMTQGALVVWRASFRPMERMADEPHRLVAACLPEPAIQTTVLARWASLLSSHYGDVPVVLDTTSLPGALELLRNAGTPVLARRQPREDRRLGQQSQDTRKHGHTFGDRERHDAYQGLQAMLRDQHVRIWCPQTLRQLQDVILDQDGNPMLLEGANERWVKATALTLSCIAQASSARPPTRQSMTPDYRDRTTQTRKLA